MYYNDTALHAIDRSNPQIDIQVHMTKETLKEPEIMDKIVATVFNKVDRFRRLKVMGDSSVVQIPGDFSSNY